MSQRKQYSLEKTTSLSESRWWERDSRRGWWAGEEQIGTDSASSIRKCRSCRHAGSRAALCESPPWPWCTVLAPSSREGGREGRGLSCQYWYIVSPENKFTPDQKPGMMYTLVIPELWGLGRGEQEFKGESLVTQWTQGQLHKSLSQRKNKEERERGIITLKHVILFQPQEDT